MVNAMIVEPIDNVVVAIEEIKEGEQISWLCEGTGRTVTALQDIPIYHKAAVCDIKKGEAVIKYGEHIGFAMCPIKTGEHVHVHNVEGHREDLAGKE